MPSDVGHGAQVARGATYLFIQGFAAAAIGVVYIMILTRVLTQEYMGVYALLTFILSLVQIMGSFALPRAAVKYIAQYLGEGNQSKARSVVARILQISLITSAAAFGLIFIPAEWLSTLMPGTTPLLFRALALACSFTTLNLILSGFLRGLQRMLEFALSNLFYAMVQSAVGAYLVYIGFGLLGIVYGWLAGLIVSCAIGLVLTAKHLGLRGAPHPIKPLIVFAYPLYVANILTLLVQWVDQLFVPFFLGTDYLGIYHIAVRASIVPTLLSNSLIMALFPKLSELYAQKGRNSLGDAFSVSTRYAAIIGFPMVIGLAVLARPIMILFAGVQYAEAALPLVIMSFAALAATIGVAILPTLMTVERTKTASLLIIVSIITNMASSYVALAYLNLGLIGPAWARTIASIVWLGVGIYALKPIFSIRFDIEAIWKTSVATLFMTAMILLTDLVRQILTPSPTQFLVFRLRWLPLYMLVGGLAYLFALVILKAIKKQDVELLRDYLPTQLKWVSDWFGRLASSD